MNQMYYHTEDEEFIRKLDEEFDVVTVVTAAPFRGQSDGWTLSIHDTRDEVEMLEDVRTLKSNLEYNRA